MSAVFAILFTFHLIQDGILWYHNCQLKVKIGLFMAKNKPVIQNITSQDEIGLEICTAQVFYQSETAADTAIKMQLGQQHRFEHFVWIWVQQGECRHVLDFAETVQQTGEWLLIRPKQIHHFAGAADWDGWGISFAPQILTPDISDKLRRLPSHSKVAQQHAPLLTQMMHTLSDLRYADDLAQSAKATLVQQQLGVFLTWLSSVYSPQNALPDLPKQRWQAFCALLETHFSTQHQLAFYADALSCHEKTLNQTCRQYAGQTAKQFVNQRILLESKRLLAYTKASVKEIAWQLGFEEATHFGKFFKKEMQKTPLEFRKEFQQPYAA